MTASSLPRTCAWAMTDSITDVWSHDKEMRALWRTFSADDQSRSAATLLVIFLICRCATESPLRRDPSTTVPLNYGYTQRRTSQGGHQHLINSVRLHLQRSLTNLLSGSVRCCLQYLFSSPATSCSSSVGTAFPPSSERSLTSQLAGTVYFVGHFVRLSSFISIVTWLPNILNHSSNDPAKVWASIKLLCRHLDKNGQSNFSKVHRQIVENLPTFRRPSILLNFHATYDHAEKLLSCPTRFAKFLVVIDQR